VSGQKVLSTRYSKPNDRKLWALHGYPSMKMYLPDTTAMDTWIQRV